MKQLFFIFLLAVILNAKDVINMATVPWKSSDQLYRTYKPLIDLIEDRTGKKVNFLISKNYMELSKRILENYVDIALFGANSYVDAKDFLGDKIIYLASCMHPNDHYNSIIITHKSSNIYKVSDLKGKNFAFTDVGSTSGYIYPNYMLFEEGIKEPKKYFKTVVMLKKHNRVYDAIAKRAIDAGGTTNTQYKEAIQRNGDIYRIIKRSDPIPNGPIVVNANMDPKMIKKLKDILKEANKSVYFTNNDSDLKGISIRSDGFYNIVRKIKAFNKDKN